MKLKCIPQERVLGSHPLFSVGLLTSGNYRRLFYIQRCLQLGQGLKGLLLACTNNPQKRPVVSLPWDLQDIDYSFPANNIWALQLHSCLETCHWNLFTVNTWNHIVYRVPGVSRALKTALSSKHTKLLSTLLNNKQIGNMFFVHQEGI